MNQSKYGWLPHRLCLIALLLLSGVQLGHAERATTFFHTDALGSVVAASDQSGALLWRKEYAPFGQQLDSTAEGEKLSYTGKEHDDDTGLTYFGARYYDPHLGRFLSADPLGFLESKPMSFNRYAYANDNPYLYVDPDGRDPERIFGIMMGIVHTKENALRIQQAELAANNFAAADGIDSGIALSEAKRAFDEGESIKGSLVAATTAMIAVVAKKKGARKNPGQRFSSEKRALVDMAKADKRRGIASEDMQAYKDLNRGLPDPFPSKQVRGPEAHPSGAPSSRASHGHVGPVDHIPIVDPTP